MDKLFAIDAQARNEKMDHAARHALRHEKAPPLLAEIRTHIMEMSKTVLPKSAAGHACSYTLALWKRLTRFLDYPELELSNNLAENSMRPSQSPPQLDPHRQRTGWTARSRHPLCHRKLPPPQDPGAQLPSPHPAWPRKRTRSAHRRHHPCRLDRKTSANVNHAFGLTPTIDRPETTQRTQGDKAADALSCPPLKRKQGHRADEFQSMRFL